jgi:hypothetical protein
VQGAQLSEKGYSSTMGMRSWKFRLAIALLGLVSVPLQGGLIVSVAIIDNTYTAYHAALASHIIAAGTMWGQYFPGTTNLHLQLTFNDNFPRATGRSTVSQQIATRNGFFIAEQGAGYEIRTGLDPNGSTHDVEFTMNSTYLQNELWFDPDPNSRTAVMPNNKTDAMSVFLHEWGHAIALNGWQDHTEGTYVDNFRSTYDELKTYDALTKNYYFNGANAMALYGGPVPVTHGNVNHIGNSVESGRPGSDLIPDLMNGVVFTHGTRYFISPMDLAITADTGLNVMSTPEPSTTALSFLAVLIGGCWMKIRSWFGRRSASA